MAGEGHMLHAIKSLKANRALLKKHRSKNKNSLTSDSVTRVEFKKVSDEQLKLVKKDIREKAKKAQIISMVQFGCILLILSMVIYFIFY